MKKRDIGLVVCLLLMALALYLWMRPDGEEEGAAVRITIDGEEYGTWPLDEDREIVIDQESGSNTVRIQDGEVFMEDADCPDQYCMKQGKIHSPRQTVVCLPHRLVVEVLENTDGAEEEPDAVVR